MSVNIPQLRQRYFMNLAMVAAMFFLLFLFVAFSWIDDLVWRVPLALAATAISVPLFAWYFIKRTAMKLLAKSPWLLGARTMKFRSDEFEVRAPTSVEVTEWSAIASIAEDTKNYYLITKTDFGYIIPKRAFGSEDRAKRFLSTAMGYWKNALSK